MFLRSSAHKPFLLLHHRVEKGTKKCSPEVSRALECNEIGISRNDHLPPCSHECRCIACISSSVESQRETMHRDNAQSPGKVA